MLGGLRLSVSLGPGLSADAGWGGRYGVCGVGGRHGEWGRAEMWGMGVWGVRLGGWGVGGLRGYLEVVAARLATRVHQRRLRHTARNAAATEGAVEDAVEEPLHPSSPPTSPLRAVEAQPIAASKARARLVHPPAP